MTRPARKPLSPRERRLLQRYQQRLIQKARAYIHLNIPREGGDRHDEIGRYSNSTVERIVQAILSEPFTAPRPKPRRKAK